MKESVEYTSLSHLYILHHFLLSFILLIFRYIITSILESQDVVTRLNFISELRLNFLLAAKLLTVGTLEGLMNLNLFTSEYNI